MGGMHKWIMKNGQVVVDEHGSRTMEIVDAHLKVTNPRDRIVGNRGRKMNLVFGMAEWLAMMFDEDSLSYFERYISTYGAYSTDGNKIDGSYGPRLHEFGDQIEAVVKLLNRRLTSRQAIMSIYSGRDLFGYGGKNTPCTVSLQFLVRNNHLDMITTMRSNDLVWGLTYDLFCFTLFQEYIANKLVSHRVQLGTYYHNAGSLHIYERDWDLPDRLARDYRWPRVLNPMPDDDKSLRNLFLVYAEPQTFDSAKIEKLGLSQWHKDFAWACLSFITRKESPELSTQYFENIKDYTIRRVMTAWLPGSEW
jgi:thymidylate synthase